MGVRRFRATAETRMKDDAKLGFDYSYIRITKKKSLELKKLGFVVTDSKEKDGYPRLFKISWKDARVEYDNEASLNENDSKYTAPQKLWIISLKSDPFKV